MRETNTKKLQCEVDGNDSNISCKEQSEKCDIYIQFLFRSSEGLNICQNLRIHQTGWKTSVMRIFFKVRLHVQGGEAQTQSQVSL